MKFLSFSSINRCYVLSYLCNYLIRKRLISLKKKNAKTIGQMTNSRRMWGFDSSTRVVRNKKGKGSYSRKGRKSYGEGAYFFAFCFPGRLPRVG